MVGHFRRRHWKIGGVITKADTTPTRTGPEFGIALVEHIGREPAVKRPRGWLQNALSAGEEVYQNHDDGDHQEDVNKTAHRVTADQAKQPQND